MTAVPTTVDQLRRQLTGGGRIGLVPTMGALHAGHLSLVDLARAECDVVVVSIFVNPLQFAPSEDFEAYPRDLPGDIDKLGAAGVDVVFVPPADAFAPRSCTVSVAGVTRHLEGASRPGHFDGVATIVTKLLNAVGPDRAYFGEKDFQQLAMLRLMVADLAAPVEIVGGAIVRDDDGLALSSRNAYLSPSERAAALALPRALAGAAASWGGDATATREQLRRTLASASGIRLDYAEVADPDTLEPLEGAVPGPARALAAIRVGSTRLIDNVGLAPGARRAGGSARRAAAE